MSKSYKEGYKVIESITANTYQWHVTWESANSIQKRPIGVHEVTETTIIAAHMAQIHKIMKNPMTLEVTKTEPVKVVTDTSTVARVYCGEPVKVLESSIELKKQSLPSVEVPPELELKQLPSLLQYACLEAG
ncbi:hypothetical protein KIW84_074578 [Lathyrus oleraceus]|uniref:Uncharacterized protein n=1 Tax=Pisum sativum TaxID=3888 RepID=A0A9D4ZX22_PEA|nr:hypothetical protein KIW84_074578 [Pisum sativum]